MPASRGHNRQLEKFHKAITSAKFDLAESFAVLGGPANEWHA